MKSPMEKHWGQALETWKKILAKDELTGRIHRAHADLL